MAMPFGGGRWKSAAKSVMDRRGSSGQAHEEDAESEKLAQEYFSAAETGGLETLVATEVTGGSGRLQARSSAYTPSSANARVPKHRICSEDQLNKIRLRNAWLETADTKKVLLDTHPPGMHIFTKNALKFATSGS